MGADNGRSRLGGQGELGAGNLTTSSSVWAKAAPQGLPILGTARAEALATRGMTSTLDKVMEPNGALCPKPGDTEDQGPGRNPAPSAGDLVASEDLEMFVLDFEDYGLWEPMRGYPSPLAGVAACE